MSAGYPVSMDMDALTDNPQKYAGCSITAQFSALNNALKKMLDIKCWRKAAYINKNRDKYPIVVRNRDTYLYNCLSLGYWRKIGDG